MSAREITGAADRGRTRAACQKVCTYGHALKQSRDDEQVSRRPTGRSPADEHGHCAGRRRVLRGASGWLRRGVSRDSGEGNELGNAAARTNGAAQDHGQYAAKLQRETIRLSQIQDIAGCRVTVHGLDEQDETVQRVSEAFSNAKVFDLRLQPRCGYRAVHTVIQSLGLPVELQIRTGWQDAWANMSELFADRFGIAVKYCGGSAEPQAILGTGSDLFRDFERYWRESARLSVAGSTLAERLEAAVRSNARWPDHQRRLSAQIQELEDLVMRHLAFRERFEQFRLGYATVLTGVYRP